MSDSQGIGSSFGGNLLQMEDNPSIKAFEPADSAGFSHQEKAEENLSFSPGDTSQNPLENLGEMSGGGLEAAYDPMNLWDDLDDCDESSPQDDNDSDYELDSNNPIIPETTPMTMELNDSNSIKLRKGILVVRKYKEGVDELNEMQSIRGYSVVDRQPPKSVRYIEGNAIERVKYFSKDAEPNAPALTLQEVVQIQNDLENSRAEEAKIEESYSQEQQRKDGISKERKRALENIKKVQSANSNV